MCSRVDSVHTVVECPAQPGIFATVWSRVESCGRSCLVWKRAAAFQGRLGVVCLSQAWRCCGTAPARTMHPIPSHPVPSNNIPSGHHTIPYHTIPYHTIPSAVACHGWGTHVPGCASPPPGVALLRHGFGAHNTSHPIPSRPVQSHPVRSPSHPIPYHTIPSHPI